MLQSIQEVYPNLLEHQVLKTLFPSLFLALVARDTNIIVHTTQSAEIQKSTVKASDHCSQAVNIFTCAAQILSTVFGMQTKRVKVRSQSPSELMESLFLSGSQYTSSTLSKRKPSRTSLPRSRSAPRPCSSHFTEGSDSTAPPHAYSIARHKTDPLPQSADNRSSHLPQAVVISNLERASRAAQLALAEVLRTRQITLGTDVWNLPKEFFIVYVSHVGDGYERPAIHTSLVCPSPPNY